MSTHSAHETRDLVSQAYEKLRTHIVHGRLAPGTRIIESDLADRLGVSRTPVRSALQRLQQEGYVQALDGGRNIRLMVAPLTQEDCREVLNLLGCLEGLAARWSAALPERERAAVAADLHRLNEELDRLLKHSGPGVDPEDVFRVHSEFHNRHLEHASAGRLLALHAAMRPQAERYRRVYLTTAPHGYQGEVEEHAAIVAAVERGDGDAAQVAVQRNWELTAERLSRIIDRHGEQGAW